MTSIIENYPLQKLNTFGIDVKARFFIEPQSISEVDDVIQSNVLKEHPGLILGEGSNILFTGDFKGLVIHPLIKGIEIKEENPSTVIVNTGAGENWDSFVSWAVKHHFGGIENLSGIPGSVGASPIQNIGAYGTEVKDVIDSVEIIDMLTGEQKSFVNDQCGFGYRDSIFKRELKNRIIITRVTFRLIKNPAFKTDYGSIRDRLSTFDEINLETIRRTILDIRNEKLPDPHQLGNAGSFFKNPAITLDDFRNLQGSFPDVPHFSSDVPEYVKIPAAWLIEKSGLKGYRAGQAGTHIGQPLVLVNYGSASGNDILELAEKIRHKVRQQFGINLELEVQVI